MKNILLLVLLVFVSCNRDTKSNYDGNFYIYTRNTTGKVGLIASSHNISNLPGYVSLSVSLG